MDCQDFYDLQEAYLNIYEEAEDDEGEESSESEDDDETSETETKENKKKKSKKETNSESLDYYDNVLSYLIDEGYADTIENAEVIMVNMSEAWIDSIFEEVLDEGNITDRPTGVMHQFARGVKSNPGKKTERYGSDKEGNPTGKYLQMKREKDDMKRHKDSEEQRRRDGQAMSRGTWDKD